MSNPEDAALLAEVVPICGNCRFHEPDEHGGGRNHCSLLEESERYKYAVNHTCDTPGRLQPLAFKPNVWKLEGQVEDLAQALRAALTREAELAKTHNREYAELLSHSVEQEERAEQAERVNEAERAVREDLGRRLVQAERDVAILKLALAEEHGYTRKAERKRDALAAELQRLNG